MTLLQRDAVLFFSLCADCVQNYLFMINWLLCIVILCAFYQTGNGHISGTFLILNNVYGAPTLAGIGYVLSFTREGKVDTLTVSVPQMRKLMCTEVSYLA